MRVLFWFLFVAMPLAALAFVARVALGLWRKVVRVGREVGAVAANAGDVVASIDTLSRDADFGSTHRQGRHRA